MRRVRFFSGTKYPHLRAESLGAFLTDENLFIDEVIVVLWIVMEKGEAFHA